MGNDDDVQPDLLEVYYFILGETIFRFPLLCVCLFVHKYCNGIFKDDCLFFTLWICFDDLGVCRCPLSLGERLDGILVDDVGCDNCLLLVVADHAFRPIHLD